MIKIYDINNLINSDWLDKQSKPIWVDEQQVLYLVYDEKFQDEVKDINIVKDKHELEIKIKAIMRKHKLLQLKTDS